MYIYISLSLYIYIYIYIYSSCPVQLALTPAGFGPHSVRV